MNKIIFLDIDGVLNSTNSLYENESLEDVLVLRLKKIVDATGAKLILSSSWRELWTAVKKLMDKLDKYDMYLSGMTDNGVELSFIKEKGLKPTKKYLEYHGYSYEKDSYIDVTHDRGAEIYKWLNDHPETNSFVILDDETFDIITYFPNNFIKTNFKTGLTDEDVKKAIELLNK